MMLQTEPTTPRTPKIRLFTGERTSFLRLLTRFGHLSRTQKEDIESVVSVSQSYAVVKNHPEHDVKRLVIWQCVRVVYGDDLENR